MATHLRSIAGMLGPGGSLFLPIEDYFDHRGLDLKLLTLPAGDAREAAADTDPGEQKSQ